MWLKADPIRTLCNITMFPPRACIAMAFILGTLLSEAEIYGRDILHKFSIMKFEKYINYRTIGTIVFNINHVHICIPDI